MGLPTAAGGSLDFYDFFVHQVWCFMYVQKVGSTSSNSANAKKGASFDTEAVKQQIEAAQKKFHSQ